MLSERRTRAVKKRLSTSYRRISILDFLVANKQTTRSALAKKYAVSTNTITKDIAFLSHYAPIYTKTGGDGGIYILPGYKHYTTILMIMSYSDFGNSRYYGQTNYCRNNCQIFKKSCWLVKSFQITKKARKITPSQYSRPMDTFRYR